jgi:branched-chain amino acid transport system permease protein
MKIAVWALAAAIAGIGGGMYVIYAGVALPQSFDTIVGLTWFAVVITNGRRSNNAALAAGLFYVFIPQIFATYLAPSWGPLPTLLFGAGAVLLARNPDGIITMNGRQLAALGRRLTGSGKPAWESGTHRGVPASAVATELEDVQ